MGEFCIRDTKLSILSAVIFVNVQDYKSSKTYSNTKHRRALTEDDPQMFHTYCKSSSPVTGLEWPRGFQEVKVPTFRDNGIGTC